MQATPISRRVVSLAVASLALLALPSAARAEEPTGPLMAPPSYLTSRDCGGEGPVPVGYRCAKSGAYSGLFVGGGVTAALGDAFNFLTIAGNGGRDPIAVVPVLGPFIAAATHKTPPSQSCAGGDGDGVCFNFNVDLSVIGYVIAGSLQTLGAAMMVSTLAVRKPRIEKRSAITVVPVPMLGPSSSGLGLAGTF